MDSIYPGLPNPVWKLILTQMLSLEKDPNAIYVTVESNKRHENTYIVAIGKLSF